MYLFRQLTASASASPVLEIRISPSQQFVAVGTAGGEVVIYRLWYDDSDGSSSNAVREVEEVGEGSQLEKQPVTKENGVQAARKELLLRNHLKSRRLVGLVCWFPLAHGVVMALWLRVCFVSSTKSFRIWLTRDARVV